jgi:hypothetical protein
MVMKYINAFYLQRNLFLDFMQDEGVESLNRDIHQH